MRTPLLPLALTLLATSAMARDRATFRYTPGMDEERPMARTVDDGELLTELDHRRDPERIHVEGDTVYLLIDASNNLPSGRKVRVIYHPPGSEALQAIIPGMLSGSASRSKVMIFRRGAWKKARQGGQLIGP